MSTARKHFISQNTATGEDEWKFWLTAFINYTEAMPKEKNALNKLNVLITYLAASVRRIFREKTTYDDDITVSQNLFAMPKKNKIFARQTLVTAF